MLQKARGKLFWIYDKLRGSKVKKHYDDISDIIGGKSYDSEAKIDKYLSEILSYAVNTTRFYSNFRNFNSIKDFPVVDKNTIRNRYDEFTGKAIDLKSAKLVSTSGSTGTPFSVHHGSTKKDRNYADNLFFSGFGDYKVGNPICYLRVWNESNKKSKLSHLIHNTYPIDISDLSDGSIKKMLRKVEHLPQNISFLGYGSTFTALADFLKRADFKIEIKPKCFFVMAEPVPKTIRNFLIEKFQCPVLSRYSNSENGFLGHQWSINSEDYIINRASYFIELLKINKNEPVRKGEPGRVVVTDLFNKAIPFIRYDTGDIAIEGEANYKGKKIPVFKSIEGRKLDFIYNSSGKLISPHTVDYAVRNTEGLLQFQIIQIEKKRYELKLLFRDKSKNKEKKICENLKKYLGSNAIIEVKYVEEIPVLSSGKRKIVVNKMDK